MKWWLIVFILFSKLDLLAQVTGESDLDTNLWKGFGDDTLQELVISGTLKEVSQKDCIIPIEVYRSSYFSKLPTLSLFDALHQINGVRPQMNCGVCNTGDIRINGLPGANTMILIDGMPIVSALGTVYGLNGIPVSMIERLEIVRGPASALYGSEAIGGLINIITKKPSNSPNWSFDLQSTSWQEHQLDMSTKWNVSKKWNVLLGWNSFYFDQVVDQNGDGFMDMSKVKRVSLFNKWNLERKSGKLFQMAGRFLYEDRVGGQNEWESVDRGGNEVYGESIYTSRVEVIGTYELPIKEHVLFSFSWNLHQQNSYYGEQFYLANQRIGFAQATWDKELGKHDVLIGGAFRHNYYDDNSGATMTSEDGLVTNTASIMSLPGLFLQDEVRLSEKQSILGSLRLDYSEVHGFIPTGRLGHKWNFSDRTLLRTNAGTGFRNVHVFAEDHAALTGARSVVFVEQLKPESSINFQSQLVHQIIVNKGRLSLDGSLFYYYFTNQIIADYDRDPSKIIYANLQGYSRNVGLNFNIDYSRDDWWFRGGFTLLDRRIIEEARTVVPILTEHFNATWTISRHVEKGGWTFDYTGNVYSPMRLPVLGDLDPRNEYSPWWQIHNFQVRKEIKKRWEVYLAMRNVLNMVPWRNNPFIIANAQDPFDRNVEFDAQGNVLPTVSNPYALTFDPSYIFTLNQGRRVVFGLRFTL